MCFPELVSNIIPIFAKLPWSKSPVDRNPSPIWSRSEFCSRTSLPISTVSPCPIQFLRPKKIGEEMLEWEQLMSMFVCSNRRRFIANALCFCLPWDGPLVRSIRICDHYFVVLEYLCWYRYIFDRLRHPSRNLQRCCENTCSVNCYDRSCFCVGAWGSCTSYVKILVEVWCIWKILFVSSKVVVVVGNRRCSWVEAMMLLL